MFIFSSNFLNLYNLELFFVKNLILPELSFNFLEKIFEKNFRSVKKKGKTVSISSIDIIRYRIYILYIIYYMSIDVNRRLASIIYGKNNHLSSTTFHIPNHFKI